MVYSVCGDGWHNYHYLKRMVYSVCGDGWHNYHYLKRMVYSVCGMGGITIIIYSVWCIVFVGMVA